MAIRLYFLVIGILLGWALDETASYLLTGHKFAYVVRHFN